MEQTKSLVPELPNKTVFFITSNQDFIVENNPLPFQQGIGYTLMVWYWDMSPVPVEFLLNDHLWDLASQGYKEIDNRGFGYFTEEYKLEETIKDYDNIEVVSLYYDAKTNTLKKN